MGPFFICVAGVVLSGCGTFSTLLETLAGAGRKEKWFWMSFFCGRHSLL